jgi:hypothetical protein
MILVPVPSFWALQCSKRLHLINDMHIVLSMPFAFLCFYLLLNRSLQHAEFSAQSFKLLFCLLPHFQQFSKLPLYNLFLSCAPSVSTFSLCLLSDQGPELISSVLGWF